MMEMINPGKWLSCFCLQFYDYLTFEDDEIETLGRENSSFGDKSEESNNHDLGSNSSSIHNGSHLTKSIKMTSRKSLCMVSKFTLCIFTYFPLVSLMEQILISMVDEIKERRMTTYAEDSGVIEDLNYEFLVS